MYFSKMLRVRIPLRLALQSFVVRNMRNCGGLNQKSTLKSQLEQNLVIKDKTNKKIKIPVKELMTIGQSLMDKLKQDDLNGELMNELEKFNQLIESTEMKVLKSSTELLENWQERVEDYHPKQTLFSEQECREHLMKDLNAVLERLIK